MGEMDKADMCDDDVSVAALESPRLTLALLIFGGATRWTLDTAAAAERWLSCAPSVCADACDRASVAMLLAPSTSLLECEDVRLCGAVLSPWLRYTIKAHTGWDMAADDAEGQEGMRKDCVRAHSSLSEWDCAEVGCGGACVDDNHVVALRVLSRAARPQPRVRRTHAPPHDDAASDVFALTSLDASPVEPSSSRSMRAWMSTTTIPLQRRVRREEGGGACCAGGQLTMPGEDTRARQSASTGLEWWETLACLPLLVVMPYDAGVPDMRGSSTHYLPLSTDTVGCYIRLP